MRLDRLALCAIMPKAARCVGETAFFRQSDIRGIVMPAKLIVRPGDKFSRLIVVKEVDRYVSPNGRKHRQVECRCKCGCIVNVLLLNLRNGSTISCGCYRRSRPTTHGLRNHPAYNVWRGMKQRCYDPSSERYHDYGGRGVSVCDIWLNDANAFINWSLANGWKQGLQIDREDNDGDYTPDNCRFVTPTRNCRNKRNNRLITIGNDTRILTEWLEIFAIGRSTFQYRVSHGWSSENALTHPVRRKRK